MPAYWTNGPGSRQKRKPMVSLFGPPPAEMTIEVMRRPTTRKILR
jgi:hypothetical protein